MLKATLAGLLFGLLFAQCGAAETIELRQRGGGYLVSGRINGAVSIDFVLDTGASDVSIPADAAQALIRSGTLSNSDFLGTQTYVLADGSRVPSKRVMLRELTVGGQKVTNVTASIAPARSPPLLGQSFLSKFPSWTLDNRRRQLVLSGDVENATPTVASGRAAYGAFARDDLNGRYGLSWGHDSASLADDAAVKGCASEKCAVVFRTGPRECGAIAMTADGRVWGGAKREARDAAQLAAIENCQKRTTTQCGLRGSACNK